jgi:hypothetical protein
MVTVITIMESDQGALIYSYGWVNERETETGDGRRETETETGDGQQRTV